MQAAEIIGDGEAEGTAAEFLRGGEVAGLERGVGVDALRVGGGFAQAGALRGLRRARHVALEAGHAAEHDPVSAARAVGLEDDLADAAVQGGEGGIERGGGHGGGRKVAGSE